MRFPLIEGPRSGVLRRTTWLIVLALVLAFGFLGTRGIWDPDEGRYTNVALTMLDSGNWIDPMRNADIGHWTKPPVTYWLIAASVAVFGQTPWAAHWHIWPACGWSGASRGIWHAAASRWPWWCTPRCCCRSAPGIW